MQLRTTSDNERIKNVVLTGSTRGIGFGMAQEFLRRGHQVVVCGRSAATTQHAVAMLSEHHEQQRILGQPCDVGRHEQVQELWDAAISRFGTVDIWINNAGLSNPRLAFWKLPTEHIRAVVHTNVLGVMYGSQVALQGMLRQGSGQIYNMEGLGSNGGRVIPGLIVYGASKSAVTYFTQGLVKETRSTPVRVGFLSPGMVVTDLLTGDGVVDSRSRRIFNILADRVETVAPYLVEQILANKRHGARIAWLTRPKIAWRLMTARWSKRNVLTNDDDGSV